MAFGWTANCDYFCHRAYYNPSRKGSSQRGDGDAWPSLGRQLVRSRSSVRTGSDREMSPNLVWKSGIDTTVKGGGIFSEASVPGGMVKHVIGKGGAQIRDLQAKSGAKVAIIQDTPEAAMEKPMRITGSPEAVETAKKLVTEVLANIGGR